MSEGTFIVRFVHRENHTSAPYKEQEYTTAEAAWEAFRLFTAPDSLGIYSQVELVRYSREEEEEYPLAQLSFPA